MPPKVFISYRRDDSRYQARMIYSVLTQVVAQDDVFMDIDSIPIGADFRKILKDWVDQCNVLLALIGPTWINVVDPRTGLRRLENPADFVRIEVAEALARNKLVVPVLLDGAAMPEVAMLPEDLKELVHRHAEFVDYSHFNDDVLRLIRKLKLEAAPNDRLSVTAPPARPSVPTSKHDYSFWERQWEKPDTRSNLIALHAIANEAPRYFADQARACISEIEDEQRRRAERERVELEQRQNEAANRLRVAAASRVARHEASERAQAELRAARYQAQGLIKLDAKITHGASEGWFQPGAGLTEWFKDNDAGPEMVVVPAGDFMMGSNDFYNTKPPHKVAIAAPYAIGRFPVTFDEWDAAFAAGGVQHKPSDQGWGRGRRPVINVSWDDASSYVSWLSSATDRTYRLLSEAEWEYAARAGTLTRWFFGDDERQLSDHGWFQANSGGKTQPVGGKRPNAFGLYDMHGNVFEWVEDHRHENYERAPVNGTPWIVGGVLGQRVVRGGAWYISPDFLASASRSGGATDSSCYYVGFRVARTLQLP